MNDIGAFLDKLPPQNLEAERCVLGSILLVNEAYFEVAQHISAKCFHSDANRRIYATIQKLIGEGGSGVVDAVTLKAALERQNELDVVGGVPYILQLLETVPHAAHAEYYAKIVKECWIRRALIEACTESLKQAFHGDADAMEIVAGAEDRIRKISEHGLDADGLVTIDQGTTKMYAEMDSKGEQVRLPIAYPSLAHHMPYLSGGDVTVVGAATMTGKTTFAMNILRPLLDLGEPILVFSEEMKAVELARKFHAMYAGVEGRHIKDGSIKNDPVGWARVNKASETIRKHKMHIHDTAELPLCEMRRLIRKAVRRLGVRLVVIDHIGLIQSARSARQQNDNERIAATSNAIKSMAMHYEIPFLVLSQLTKDVEKRPDKRPNLGDLKHTGDIAQDANNVLFLHRPDKYDKEDRPGELDVIVAKLRDGPTGDVVLRYKPKFDQIEDHEESFPEDF